MKNIEELICLGYTFMTSAFILYSASNEKQIVSKGENKEIINKPAMEYIQRKVIPMNYFNLKNYS
jgi:hypothetical protein